MFLTEYYIVKDGKNHICHDYDEWIDHMKFGRRLYLYYHPYKKICVSTVFLGISHGNDLFGNPLLYETMIFSDNDDETEYCERCATLEEARTQYKEALSHVFNNMIGPGNSVG